MTGLITQFLGAGLAASRPATPDVPTGALAFYFATDTEVLSLYDPNDAAWQTAGSGALADGDYGDVTVSSSGTVIAIDNDVVSDAKLRNSAALSVIGRSANSSGDPADIAAANDGEVLRRSGTTVGFGTIATSGIANDAVTLAKIANASANSKLLGSGAAGSGADYAEITLGTGLSMSGTTLNAAAGSFRGALVHKAADQTAANYTTATAIAWDSETNGYDTDSIHDTVTNNSRLTVPSGVSKVRLLAGVEITSLSADVWAVLFIAKNGSSTYIGSPRTYTEVGNVASGISVASAVLAVSPTDYFEAFLQIETDTSVTLTATRSWFAMEIIE